MSICFNLNNNTEIPLIGFGTWQIPDGEDVSNAVKTAVQMGYRNIDTAAIYRNEKGIGEGIKECEVDRKELFITSKLWNTERGYDTTFFFVIIFILMSGLFTPIESMPKWAQYTTIPNPVAHFVSIMRAVLLKNASFSDVTYYFKITAILAVVFNALAIWSYKKVS